ncbi:hypothetical protein F4054_07750 [Candidatus Poribacteria bacterium]|nr:hypothetical protein [Candidatus Poribacteria bacterium]MYG06688.1 hypothetical protein [Candidatus Poribacteria bacterium]MYK22139.1 hypothetical protein [Candidatus Poribacteria bacterium]
MQMTDQEMREAMERADGIVAKVRALIALEDKVLGARASVRQLPVNSTNASSARLQENLVGLEAQLKESVAELDTITEELHFATPCFRAYVLPQISELVGTLKACDAAERNELKALITTLTDENTETTQQLEEAILTQLKNNLERTFSMVDSETSE